MWSKTELRGLSPLANYTDRPPLVGEVSANFCGLTVPRGQRDGSLRTYSRVSRLKLLLFLPSSSSVVLNDDEWIPFQAHYLSERLVAPGIEPGPLEM
jgi:hypothetical protein